MFNCVKNSVAKKCQMPKKKLELLLFEKYYWYAAIKWLQLVNWSFTDTAAEVESGHDLSQSKSKIVFK